MANPFHDSTDGAAGPSRRPYPITPSDTDALPIVPKGIYVGTGGDLRLRGAEPDAAAVTYRNLGNGGYVAVAAGYVLATGTTASDLVAEA